MCSGSKVAFQFFDGVQVTNRQFEYLQAIEHYWVLNKCAPTVRELSEILKVGWTSVQKMIKRLDRLELVSYELYSIRTLRTRRMKIVFEDRTKRNVM